MTQQEVDLGRLANAVENLVKRADEDRETRLTQEALATAERRALSMEIHNLAAVQRDQARRLDEIQPVVDAMKSWRARITGAMMVLGFFGAAVGAGFAFFQDQIKDLLTR